MKVSDRTTELERISRTRASLVPCPFIVALPPRTLRPPMHVPPPADDYTVRLVNNASHPFLANGLKQGRVQAWLGTG